MAQDPVQARVEAAIEDLNARTAAARETPVDFAAAKKAALAGQVAVDEAIEAHNKRVVKANAKAAADRAAARKAALAHQAKVDEAIASIEPARVGR